MVDCVIMIMYNERVGQAEESDEKRASERGNEWLCGGGNITVDGGREQAGHDHGRKPMLYVHPKQGPEAGDKISGSLAE
jgi:hypothetical protein